MMGPAREPSRLSRRVGPFILEEPLGRGGMGVVYRARHEESGRRVALKTVEGADARLLESIRREIDALAHVSHPGIVPIVAHGLEGGIPWYAMEIVRGVTLLGYARKLGVPADRARPAPVGQSAWWTEHRSLAPAQMRQAPSRARRVSRRENRVKPAALASLLTVIRRLCAPLAYLHGEGFVHRDLKPGNVLVRDDGMPVILDFGLAARFGASVARETIDVEGELVGTIAYLAPEQGQGQLVDARADLYSLGGILFELLTGRPPFEGGTPYEALQRRYVEAPPRPSDLAEGIPPGLDELVLRLLSRDPADRFGYADDVARSLASLGAGDGLAPSGPAPKDYLYRPGLVGRGDVLDDLARRVEGVEERGGLVLLTGESGIGKTRLCMALAARALDLGLSVLVGECSGRSVEGARPFGALAGPLQTVADRCRHVGDGAAARIFGSSAGLLAQYAPSIAALPGVDATPPAPLPIAQAKQRLYRALRETFERLGRDRPVLLVVDDLQWADDLTLGFLEHVARSRPRRLLVVGTFRSEEVSPGISDLLAVPGADVVHVGPLPAAAVRSMCGGMLALHEPPRGLLDALEAKSDGNPFFVAEYLRTAVFEGLLHRDDRGRWRAAGGRFDALPLPGAVRDLVGRRLDGIVGVAREVLDIAATIGREASGRILSISSGLSDAALFEGLTVLLARQVIEEPAPQTFRFVHDKLHEVAYERIAPDRRPALHRAAAEAMESSPEARSMSAALGLHWERAGDRERARAHYLPAARQARDAFALDDAERLYEAYLGLVVEPTAESIGAQNELGQRVLRHRGEGERGREMHADAARKAAAIGAPSAQAESLRCLGAALQDLGRWPEARDSYERGLAIARRAKDAKVATSLLVNLGNVLRIQGEIDASEKCYVECLRLRRRTGTGEHEGVALSALAALVHERGGVRRARRLYERALASDRAQKDVRGEAITLANLAGLHMEQGRLAEAMDLYQRSLAVHEKTQDRLSEAQVLANVAALLHTLGRIPEAEATYEKALGACRDLGIERSEAHVLDNMASLYQERGEAVRARELASQALSIHRRLGDRRFEGIALAAVASIDVDLGRLQAARRGFEKAIAIHREVSDLLGEASASIGLSRIARRRRDHAAAGRFARRAARLAGGIGESAELLRAEVELAHVALASGRSPHRHVARARALLERMSVSPESPLARAVDDVSRAPASTAVSGRGARRATDRTGRARSR
ncbi:MAG: tetratricopeptide repeat protein [Acidobacteriota bacterium]